MEKAIGGTDYTHRPVGGKRPSLRLTVIAASFSLEEAYLTGQRAAPIALTSVLYFDTLSEPSSMRKHPTAELRWTESLI